MSARLDSLFTAETPEGIALVLRPAGVVARFHAFAIDGAIRMGLLIAASIALGVMGRFGTGVFLIVYFALEWLYPVVFELLPAGATPGKRAMGLRVVMDSGLPVTPAASVVRNLLRVADFMPMLYAFGVVCMGMRPDFKRLGDLAAGTLVVYTQAARLHGELPAAEPCAPARPLSGAEQAVIVAWAGRASRLTAARLEELAVLARAVTGGAAPGAAVTPRLLGVAQWLLGKR
jgi:uncharacterized RDD family membrane protein YckC